MRRALVFHRLLRLQIRFGDLTEPHVNEASAVTQRAIVQCCCAPDAAFWRPVWQISSLWTGAVLSALLRTPTVILNESFDFRHADGAELFVDEVVLNVGPRRHRRQQACTALDLFP